MSFFLTYAADSEEYLLKPAGYGLLIILLAALLFVIYKLGKVSLKTQKMQTKQLVTCSAAMALAVVTSYIKVASLPFGGSITLFSMMFICLIGYIYGANHRNGLRNPAVPHRTVYLCSASGASRLPDGLRRTGTGRAFQFEKAWSDHWLSLRYLQPLYLPCALRLHIFCRLCTGRYEPIFIHAGI